LNFVNLIMFPLLLGSAVDYGVYMVVAFRTHSPTVGELMATTGRSVLYCMGTTLIGFGSFVTSSYTGLRSMGVASLWGYAGATFGALVVLPAILGGLRKK
jgi:predicted RND superfamily exporter protein